MDPRGTKPNVTCYKMIMYKAKALFDNGNSGPSAQDAFVASRGWLQKFMQRNALSCRRRTAIAQKDPSHMIDKLVSYILHVRRLQHNENFNTHLLILSPWMKRQFRAMWFQRQL